MRAALRIACVFLALAAGTAWGLSPRVAVCTPAGAPPKLDGKLDDACWQTAGAATDFLLDSGKGFPSDRTTARLCFDGDFLYVGLECMESDYGSVKALVRNHDGSVDSDDDIEIFLDTSRDRRSFHQFLFNTVEARGDLLSGNAAWDCDWTARVAKAADRWTAEVAIPLQALGGAKVGDEWGFNIGRGQPLKRAWASFAGATGRWNNPAEFATLKFAAKAEGEGRLFPAPSAVEGEGAGTVRVYTLHPERGLDLLRLPKPGEEYLAAFATPGEAVPFTFHVLNLDPKNAAAATISATSFTGPAGKLDVPDSSFLYLYPKMAGDYMWEFLGPGRAIKVEAGQRGGFWLDFTVPADAKPGVYATTVTLEVNVGGKPAKETRALKLLVLPFTLEANPTSCGFHYPKERDPGQVRESLRLMREHGMTTFAPYGDWGGDRGVAEYINLHKEFGFTGKLIYADSVMYIGDQLGRAMKLPTRGPKLRDSHRTWEINDDYKRRYVAEVKKYFDAAKAAGRPDVSFSIGDELTSDGFYGAQHLAERAQALRAGLPDINLTTDANGYKEVIGASKSLTCIGINDGWSGPDNHNPNIKLITEKVLNEIKANGCVPEFVNTGMGRYMFGLYLWRMSRWGIASKIEWIWHSDRMEPGWLNVHRENGRTFVTVALKQSRMGTYDARYAATLDALARKTGDARAQQLLADVTSHIPIALAEARADGWSPARCDAARWMIAKEIMRLTGPSAGVAPDAGAPAAPAIAFRGDWRTVPAEKNFVRHVSRTFTAYRHDPAGWKNAEVIRGAYRDSDLSLVEGMMEVRAMYDNEGVRLAVDSHEPSPGKIAAGTRGDDDPNLWQVDDIEIFVAPGKTGEYYHLVYDVKGTKSDWKKQDIAWNGEWKVIYSRLEGNTWKSEVSLPFAVFGGKDKPWGLMVGRGSPTRNEYFGIMPIKGSWHDVSQFGTLEFGEPKPYVDSVEFSRLEVGKNTVTVAVTNPTAQDLPAKVWLVYPGGATTVDVPAMEPGKSAKVPLEFNIATPGMHEIEVKLTSPVEAPFDREVFSARVDELMTLALDPDAVFSGALTRSGTVALGLPKEKLGDYALEIALAGMGGSVTVDRLAGNRLAFELTLPNLPEGKYRLVATLRPKAGAAAQKRVDLFVTRGPDYGK